MQPSEARAFQVLGEQREASVAGAERMTGKEAGGEAVGQIMVGHGKDFGFYLSEVGAERPGLTYILSLWKNRCTNE